MQSSHARPWFLEWLPVYRPEWLRPDIVAGLTTGAVVVPKAMAYATVAGLPAQVGIYTAFVPMIVYAVLGTSRPLSVSTTTTIGILTGAQLAAIAPTGDPAQLLASATTLTVLVGIMLLAASPLRLGAVASFISEPVLTGFKAGVGLVIVLDQVPKLLGIHFDKGGFGTSISVDEMMRQIKWISRSENTPWYSMTTALVEQKPVTIRGQETTMSISEGTNDQGVLYRVANAEFQGNGDGPAVVMIVGPADEWDVKTFEDFIASIQ